MRKLAVAAAVVTAVAVVGGGAAYWYRMHWLPYQDLLPDFIEPPPGPRGPNIELGGFVVGKTTLDEVKRRTEGMSCTDTSIRALMSVKREKVKAEIEAAKAKGEAVDGITGASLVNYRSKKERNPQIRLSCEGVVGTSIGEGRSEAEGRLLFVFDSPTHPLRHVSFHRKIRDPILAREELLAAIERSKKALGDPHKSVNEIAEGNDPIPKGTLIKRSWNYGDLEVEVTAFPFGSRGIDIGEDVQVPWPVR